MVTSPQVAADGAAALAAGDFDGARQALVGAETLEARALADGGLALISQGRLKEGFARLDEAMAPLSAGEVHNPLMGGSIFCALLTACERTGEMRRAEEWAQACREFADRRLGDNL